MADGITLNATSGGNKVDTEDIGARGHLQRIKLALGALDVDGGDVSPTNPLPAIGYVTPDGGSTFYAILGAASGIQSVNSNLQSSTNIVGVMYDYFMAMGKGLVSGIAIKILKKSGNLSTGGSTTWNSAFTDQNGASYATVTTGKTFYIKKIIVSLAQDSLTNINSANVMIGDGTNRPIFGEVTSGGPLVFDIDGMYSLPAAAVLNVVFGTALAAKEAGITIIGWEE